MSAAPKPLNRLGLRPVLSGVERGHMSAEAFDAIARELRGMATAATEAAEAIAAIKHVFGMKRERNTGLAVSGPLDEVCLPISRALSSGSLAAAMLREETHRAISRLDLEIEALATWPDMQRIRAFAGLGAARGG